MSNQANRRRMSRRKFLQMGSALAGTAVAGPVIAACAPAATPAPTVAPTVAAAPSMPFEVAAEALNPFNLAPTEVDGVFFDTLEHVILADAAIDPSEQLYLLKMIYSDNVILPREREFLTKIRGSMTQPNPDFERLYENVMAAPSTNWCVGGK